MKKQFLSLIAVIGLALGSSAQAMDKSAKQPTSFAKIAGASEADLAKDFAEIVKSLEAELAKIPRDVYLEAVKSDEYKNNVQEIFSNPKDLDTVLANQKKQFKSHIDYIKHPELESPSAYEDLEKAYALIPLELFLYVKTIKAQHATKALRSHALWENLVEKAVKDGKSVDEAAASTDTLLNELIMRKIKEVITPPKPAASVSTK